MLSFVSSGELYKAKVRSVPRLFCLSNRLRKPKSVSLGHNCFVPSASKNKGRKTNRVVSLNMLDSFRLIDLQ